MWWWVSLQVLRHQAGALGWPRGGGRRHLRVLSHCRCFLSGALALLATVLHVCTSGDFLGQLFQKKSPSFWRAGKSGPWCKGLAPGSHLVPHADFSTFSGRLHPAHPGSCFLSWKLLGPHPYQHLLSFVIRATLTGRR